MADYNNQWNALVIEFQVIMKRPLKDVQKALSVETKYSVDTIRRYRSTGYPPQNSMEKLVKGVTRLACRWKMPKVILTEKLLAFCTEDFRRRNEKEHEGEMRIINWIDDIYMNPYGNNLLEICEEELKSVVELDGLKDKIVKFLNGNKEEILYIFGFPGTGMTKSVFKILQRRTKRILTIDCDTEKDSNWMHQLQYINESVDCVVVRIGKKSLPEEFYDFICTNKIIVLANSPAENYYDERINSISFND